MACCSTILLVIVPIFIPTAKALGIDLVHFGVVVVVRVLVAVLVPVLAGREYAAPDLVRLIWLRSSRKRSRTKSV